MNCRARAADLQHRARKFTTILLDLSWYHFVALIAIEETAKSRQEVAHFAPYCEPKYLSMALTAHVYQ